MFLLGFSILGSCNLNSQNNKTLIKGLQGAETDAKTLDTYIEHLMDSIGMPGLSIAVINDNKLVYHQVFGVTNVDTQTPVTKQTIFEGASLSKPIFAYFAMKMAEKGLLDLDRPMVEYLPHPGIDSSSQELYKTITPRMVLSHSTGFPNWSHGEMIKLAFTPGTGFSYSGEAYQYLAAVVGQLNGVGIQDDLNAVYMKEVGIPLGMKHTSFTWNAYLEKHKATGHDDGKVTDNSSQGKNFGAAYSIHSEAIEYAKFLIAMLEQKGMSKPFFNDMFKEHTRFNDDNPIKQQVGQTGWGLGFAQKPTPEGMMHLHTGNNHDFQSYAMILPEQKYGIVFFTNSDTMEAFLEGFTILGKQF